MRSFREISFRLCQEAANLWLLWNPPACDEPVGSPLAALPDPLEVAARLLGSSYALEVERIAVEILDGRFRLLGLPAIDLGKNISWRRDPMRGQQTGLEYFRRIPYLDFARAGDHKTIWELNRHQHLVLLAQAHLLTGRTEYLHEIPRHIDSWIEDNPFQRGINWASALEVGFRALSWLWVLHLTGKKLSEDFRRRWARSLYQHGLHLEHNLSVYFSPNTHLLGEAVALHALGKSVPDMPRAARWRALGHRVVVEQLDRQVRADGSHYEQSSYYHLYAIDFFLFHFLLAGEVPPSYRDKLIRMADFLDSLVSSEGILPLIGDEDGGRLFHPYGDRRMFASATLSTCALALDRPEWLGNSESLAEQAAWWTSRAGKPAKPAQPASCWFPDAGLAVMRSECAHVIFDAGAFGSGSGGHSHADTLSVVAFRNGQELLIDPGTFTYVADPSARDRYRSTAAHNTIWIHDAEQGTAQGPFRWSLRPAVEKLSWDSNERRDSLDVRCSYAGFEHRRSLLFQKPDVLIVADRVNGPAGEYSVDQRWLCPADVAGNFLACDPPASAETAERSRAFGSSEPAMRWVARHKGPLPALFVAVIHFRKPSAIIRVHRTDGAVTVEYEGGSARFPDSGAPETME